MIEHYKSRCNYNPTIVILIVIGQSRSFHQQRKTSVIIYHILIYQEKARPLKEAYARACLPVFRGRERFISSKTCCTSSWRVTSKWYTCRLSEHAAFKLSSPAGVKQVANTWNPIWSSRMAVSLPNPESQPVISTYLLWYSPTVAFGRNFFANIKKNSKTNAPANSTENKHSAAIFVYMTTISVPVSCRCQRVSQMQRVCRRLPGSILECVEHCHTWEWKSRLNWEDLSKSKVPVYPASRNLLCLYLHGLSPCDSSWDNNRKQSLWETRWHPICQLKGLGLKLWHVLCLSLCQPQAETSCYLHISNPVNFRYEPNFFGTSLLQYLPKFFGTTLKNHGHLYVCFCLVHVFYMKNGSSRHSRKM